MRKWKSSRSLHKIVKIKYGKWEFIDFMSDIYDDVYCEIFNITNPPTDKHIIKRVLNTDDFDLFDFF